MNKLIKGAIAGAAGLTLLMGGAGTFALWNADAAVSGGTIVAGDLTIAAQAGAWKNGQKTIDTIKDYRIVPGETLTYTQDLLVTATGDNIQAKAALGDASFTAATAATNADVELATYLSENTTVAAVVGTKSLVGFTFTPSSA